MVGHALLLALGSLTGDARAGGGYSHNHPNVDWHTLETETFLFFIGLNRLYPRMTLIISPPSSR